MAGAETGESHVTTKLAILRSQLASLRRARRVVRWATAWSALATALLWMLAGVFVVDVIFEMSILQRVILLAFAAAGGLGVFVWLVRPLLGRRETDLDMALLVERQQGIDSDLVAALQFEAPGAQRWGSGQLREAVVDYVAQLGRGLDVFVGFSRAQMARRAWLLVGTLLIVAGACAWRPDYARAFLLRLALADEHYPTATIIERMLINESLVLAGGVSPSPTTAAEGRPVTFTVLASGVLPRDDELRELQLAPLGGGRERAALKLERMSGTDRAARLHEAEREIRQAVESTAVVTGPWIERVAALLEIDAPRAAVAVRNAPRDAARLDQALASIETAAAALPDRQQQSAVYTATLEQMVGSVWYGVRLNDAWTNWAVVKLVPLPEVEVQLSPVPPAYARAGDVAVPPGTLKIYVLQGSAVNVAVRPIAAKGSVKALREAWLTTKGEQPQRIALERRVGADGERWVLDRANTPLARIDAEVQFDVQVTDADGLHLRQAPQCAIHLMADRPPSGSASIVSRVVLPTARPTVSWQGVTDDYGVSGVRLHVDVYRRSAEQASGDPAQSAAELDPSVVAAGSQPKERKTYELLDKPATVEGLPLSGSYQLDLAPLDLKKGDGVNVILEVVDYRGELPGVSYLGDPLPLEISDENGVKLSVLEPDEKAEKTLTEIRNELLETGDSP
jgi:hypothetical protein